MRHPIVKAHQEALSMYEDVKHEVRCCAQDPSTNCQKPCPCDVYQRMLHQEEVVKEKAEALKKHNEQIIAQNDIHLEKQREINEQKRKKREERIERNRREEEHRKQRILEEKLLKQQSQSKEVPTIVSSNLKGKAIKGLTVKLYNKHRNVEEMSDSAIRDKYDIPASSFAAWKKANELTRSFTSAKAREEAKGHERTKTVARSEYERVVKELEAKTEEVAALQTKLEMVYEAPPAGDNELALELQETKDKLSDANNRYDELKQQHDKLVFELNMQQEMNETRQNVVVKLEKELEELKEMNLTNGSEAATESNVDYKVRYEKMCDTSTHFEHLYNATALAYETLQREADTMMMSKSNEVEELAEHVNKQMKQWDKYENDYLSLAKMWAGRIQVLKEENEKQRRYIEQLENKQKTVEFPQKAVNQ